MILTADCFHFARKGATAADLLEYCHTLGASGVEAPLGSPDPAQLRSLRERAEKLGMELEIWASLPEQDPSAFERTVTAARQAGAARLRAFCLGGRRYEVFRSLDDWKRFAADSRDRLRRAVPILEKHRMPLGLENHKDWTAGEMLALMQEFGGEYLGVCLDTGNNIALLDDTAELVEQLAPYTVSVHLKDMAVEEYEEGFLLADVPFGDGMLDLRRIVETVRKARPRASFIVEMMTRSPLRIPCLTPGYWITFPHRGGEFLARTLRMVRANRPPKPLARVESLTPAARARLEEDNVRLCLAYARERLGL